MFLRLRHGAAILAVGSWLSGCYPPTDSPPDEQKNPFFLEGRRRVSARDYKGAIEAFEQALEKNPKSPLIHFELGVLFDQQENDYPAAIYHYQRAIKLRPTGHPAELARQLVPGCKRELLKAESLGAVNPGALRDFERLKDENNQLREQVASLQADLRARNAAVNHAPAPAPTSPPVTTTRPAPNSGREDRWPPPYFPEGRSAENRDRDRSGATRGNDPSSGITPLPPRQRPASGERIHYVRSGETLASIARQYGIRLSSLLAANPHLEPRRLKTGDAVKMPAP